MVSPDHEYPDREETFDFSTILEDLKDGARISREGWNGKFLYLVPRNIYDTHTKAAKDYFGASVPYEEYIAMKTVGGFVVPWAVSHTDLLARDWFIVT